MNLFTRQRLDPGKLDIGWIGKSIIMKFLMQLSKYIFSFVHFDVKIVKRLLRRHKTIPDTHSNYFLHQKQSISEFVPKNLYPKYFLYSIFILCSLPLWTELKFHELGENKIQEFLYLTGRWTLLWWIAMFLFLMDLFWLPGSNFQRKNGMILQ